MNADSGVLTCNISKEMAAGLSVLLLLLRILAWLFGLLVDDEGLLGDCTAHGFASWKVLTAFQTPSCPRRLQLASGAHAPRLSRVHPSVSRLSPPGLCPPSQTPLAVFFLRVFEVVRGAPGPFCPRPSKHRGRGPGAVSAESVGGWNPTRNRKLVSNLAGSKLPCGEKCVHTTVTHTHTTYKISPVQVRAHVMYTLNAHTYMPACLLACLPACLSAYPSYMYVCVHSLAWPGLA